MTDTRQSNKTFFNSSVWKLVAVFVGPIGFIMMGAALIQKDSTLAQVIGYVNIVFWSCLILFTIYKLATKK